MHYNQLLLSIQKGNKVLAVLLDPDKIDFDNLPHLIAQIVRAGAGLILIGGSEVFTDRIDELILEIKDRCEIAVFLFPGNPSQISLQADGILFLSLLSGRNPDFLIGHHVKAAPLLHNSNLEIIPTAYILVDGGRETAVSRISQTKPLSDEQEIISTALAGELLGQKMIYLEAGSGAEKPVDLHIVQKVKDAVTIPVIVGGGIRSKAKITEIFKAGADIVVIGTAFENDIHFFDGE